MSDDPCPHGLYECYCHHPLRARALAAEAECERLEAEVDGLRKAQTCASCGSLICPPMQCGACTEREEPVPGMPARPVTAALRERIETAERERDEARAECGELRAKLDNERWQCPGCETDRRVIQQTCCNPLCKGEWGTGCYHCHHPRYVVECVKRARDMATTADEKLQAECERLRGKNRELNRRAQTAYSEGRSSVASRLEHYELVARADVAKLRAVVEAARERVAAAERIAATRIGITDHYWRGLRIMARETIAELGPPLAELDGEG